MSRSALPPDEPSKQPGSDRLDRRAFLAGVGSLGLALTTGRGASAKAKLPPVTGAGPSSRARIAKAGSPKTLQQAIKGHVFHRGQPGFGGAAHVFNPRFDSVQPSAVARPINDVDVRNAIRFTVAHNMPVRARSGGHSYAGYSTLSGGVVLDLRKLNSIHVDKHAGTATVGAGVQLIDIYAGLAKAGATLPAGSCPSVGVSGVTLGGGFGLAGRHFGLSLDNLMAVKIVTADGRLRTVDKKSDADLLWALKGGGGGNFGVVTEFTFKVHPLPASAAYFNVTWPWSSGTAGIDAWQSWAPHVTDKITSILHVNSARSHPAVPPSITANGQYLGSASALPSLLAPLLSVPGANLVSHFDLPYVPLQLLWAGCTHDTVAACHTMGAGPGGTLKRLKFNAKSDYVATPLSSAGRNAVVAAAESAVASGGALLCDAYGGAINRVAPGATAFVHRQQLFCIQYYGNGPSAAWIDQAWSKLRPFVSGMAYQNYIDPHLKGWQQAYYGNNYKRLKATRKRIDPHHYFNFPQAIGR
ncbi:MAG: FAD-dependent oxidoreductase [Actinomycetota bacterium]|nr:FAD-dependent oxidoreductase [Actinomycetota bacterium]